MYSRRHLTPAQIGAGHCSQRSAAVTLISPPLEWTCLKITDPLVQSEPATMIWHQKGATSDFVLYVCSPPMTDKFLTFYIFFRISSLVHEGHIVHPSTDLTPCGARTGPALSSRGV